MIIILQSFVIARCTRDSLFGISGKNILKYYYVTYMGSNSFLPELPLQRQLRFLDELVQFGHEHIERLAAARGEACVQSRDVR